ncbi:MAG: S41 family peptidase [Calditrichia bacterium]
MGTKTFGKGLVQQVYPIDKIDDAFLKITTAKYYVPSGRCIQKEDYKKDKDIFPDHSDSTDYDNYKKYFTRNNRIVHGGGGITPDIEIDTEKMNPYTIALWAKGHFFRFTVDYLSKHPEIKSPSEFQVNSQILAAFKDYLKDKDLQFELDGEDQLKEFLSIAKEENYNSDLQDLVTVALQKLDAEKLNEFDRNTSNIKESLELEFAEKLGGSTARIAAMLKHDETLDKALQILHSQTEYRKVLAIKD